MSTTIKIQGKMITINEYYQVIIDVSNPEIFANVNCQGKVPFKTSEDGKVIAKIKINNWNRSNKFMEHFDSMSGSLVTAVVTVRDYKFVDKEENDVAGVSFSLQRLILSKE